MRPDENLTTLENTLVTLTNEHNQILEELSLIEGLPLTQALTKFHRIKRFLMTKHHKREDNVLFEWMLHQNEKTDQDIIDRMRRDHQELEKLLESIGREKDFTLLAYDLKDFIDLYREHVELEEKFIFQIARGLISAKKF